MNLLESLMRYVDKPCDLRTSTLVVTNGLNFEELWRTISPRLSADANFRGYAGLCAQVNELEAAGRLPVHAGRIERS